MEMQDKEFDGLFGSKLNMLEVEPSARVWNGIDNELTANKRRKVLIPILSAAASVIVLITAGLLFIPVKIKVNNNGKLVKTTLPPRAVLTAINLNGDNSKLNEAHRSAKAMTHASKMSVLHNVAPSGIIYTDVLVAQAQPGQPETTSISPRQPVINPVETAQLNIKEPVIESPAISYKPLAGEETPMVTKLDAEPIKSKPKIRRLGDVINFVVGKVDKRPDKIIEFNANEDEEAKITGVNLGIVKIKKDQ